MIKRLLVGQLNYILYINYAALKKKNSDADEMYEENSGTVVLVKQISIKVRLMTLVV